MPLYEYECPKCHLKTEELHKSDVVMEPECSKCKGTMVKVVSKFCYRDPIYNRSVDAKIDYAIGRSKDIRREAEEQSPRGADPYSSLEAEIPEVDVVDQI